ncbi:hypothetical protein M0R45_012217 [Rubus argutus]|uniref:Centromere protein O n=1 Tax=Rubus argutus TaxID=59490 RepID=A0AAW1YC27_RUBAR
MDYSDTEDLLRRRSRKIAYLGESARRQFESPSGRSYGLMGELVTIRTYYCFEWTVLNYTPEEDIRLEATRSRLSNALKRHGDLAERMSRDSDKTIYERLHKEFEAARALQTQEIYLDGEEWNDGLLATVRERVHMEVDRKAMARDVNMLHGPHFQERITYKVGDKVICCLEGARIGILYETSYAGEPCDIYHLVLESKSFLEKMTVLEHTIPFFLPLREAENDLLSSNAMKFIDYVGELLQAYVDRKEQVRLVKELYGNQIKEIHCSLTYHLIYLQSLILAAR